MLVQCNNTVSATAGAGSIQGCKIIGILDVLAKNVNDATILAREAIIKYLTEDGVRNKTAEIGIFKIHGTVFYLIG